MYDGVTLVFINIPEQYRESGQASMIAGHEREVGGQKAGEL